MADCIPFNFAYIGLNAASDGTVSSPIQKNLKKHNVLAAHSMIVSNLWRPWPPYPVDPLQDMGCDG